MTDSHGPSNTFKRQILQECKRLAKQGQLIDATHLFNTYFPEKNFYELDKMYF